MMMRLLIPGLIVLLAFLQYELWFSSSGVRQYFTLKEAIREQQQQNQQMASRNQALSAEINNLKQGQEAVEEHARNDLGLVKKDEVFYQVVNSANTKSG